MQRRAVLAASPWLINSSSTILASCCPARLQEWEGCRPLRTRAASREVVLPRAERVRSVSIVPLDMESVQLACLAGSRGRDSKGTGDIAPSDDWDGRPAPSH